MLKHSPSAPLRVFKEMADDLHLYLRDLPIVARRVGLLGRAIRFIKRHRAGRCNEYEIMLDKPLRHPLESHCTVGELIELVTGHDNVPSELPLDDA